MGIHKLPRCPMPTTRSNRTSTLARWRSTTPKHHQTYVDKLNAALDQLSDNDLKNMPVDD